MKIAIISILLALVITGCATKSTPISRVPFPENEYVAIAEQNKNSPATAIIKGQAFLKTRGGDVKVAAGEEVLLNPVTSYSTQWYNAVLNGTNGRLVAPDRRYDSFIKSKVADASGKFEFKKVPAGEYYITTKVSWETPTGYAGTMEIQGARLVKRISVADNEELEIILSR